MPRIPSEFDLGGLPSLNSGRRVATYDTSAVGRGVEAMGQGLQNAGASINTAVDREDNLDLARARSNFLTKKIEIDSEFANDTNYMDLTQRYQARLKEVESESAGFITQPRKREIFSLSVADDVARGTAYSTQLARRHEADANIADANTRLQTIRDAALKTGDDVERGKLIETGKQILDGLQQRGFVSAEAARSTWQSFRQDYGAAWLKMQPVQRQLEITRDAPANEEQELDRLLFVEGKGKNSKSSADGTGQFINSTWLDMIKRYRPDIADGRSDAEILAFRSDDKLGREMARYYMRENAAKLEQGGVQPTSGNKYLAHFLGPVGAVAVAKAAPGTPVIDVLTQAVGAKKAKQMVEANPSILSGKTAETVLSWADRKMGDGVKGTPAEFLPFDKRAEFRMSAERAFAQQVTAQASARSEEIERQIIDANAGKIPLAPRSAIELDPLLGEAKRNALLKQYDSAAADDRVYADGLAKLATQDAIWNPLSDADKKTLSILDTRSGVVAGLAGSNPDAAGEAVRRFSDIGMVSREVKGTLEGMIRGGDAKQLGYAMSTLDAMYRRNPKAFAESFDKDTAKTLMAWQSSANQDPGAFREKLNRASDPATIRARETAEKDARKLVADMPDKAVLSVLDESWFSDPEKPIGSRDAPGMAVYREQYADLYAEGYAANDGNKNAAKLFADTQIKKTWAVSPSGGGRVMMHAPETLPDAVFPTVGGSRDWMKKQVETEVAKLVGIENYGQNVGSMVATPGAFIPTKALPTYGLVTLPGTVAEIEAVRAGRKLPGDRQSPAWMLVYVDPVTQLPQQKLFYFDVAAAQAERDKTRGDLDVRHRRAVERTDAGAPVLSSSVMGTP